MPDHDDAEDCRMVLARVQEFLDHELDEMTEEKVREHLAACEPCMDEADISVAVRQLIKRASQPARAPDALVNRISFRISVLRVERPR